MKLEELDSQLEKNQLSGFWRTRVPSHASEAPYLWKWEPLLDGLKTGLSRSALPPAAEARIELGVLGERAEVLGAVALALRDSGLGFANHEGVNDETRTLSVG